MKQNIFLATMAILASACSCTYNAGSSGTFNNSKSFEGATSQVISTEDFSGLTNATFLPVIYSTGEKCEVRVEGDESMFSIVKPKIKGEQLTLEVEKGNYKDLWLRIIVTSPTLSSVNQAGSGNINCLSITPQSSFEIDLGGSGNITADTLYCQNLRSDIAGSGSIQINYIGCNDAKANIAGSGSLKIDEAAIANDLKLDIAGSGNIKINNANVLSTLKASIAGSGNVKINGNAERVDASIAGSGNISGQLKYNKINRSKAGSGKINL